MLPALLLGAVLLGLGLRFLETLGGRSVRQDGTGNGGRGEYGGRLTLRHAMKEMPCLREHAQKPKPRRKHGKQQQPTAMAAGVTKAETLRRMSLTCLHF